MATRSAWDKVAQEKCFPRQLVVQRHRPRKGSSGGVIKVHITETFALNHAKFAAFLRENLQAAKLALVESRAGLEKARPKPVLLHSLDDAFQLALRLDMRFFLGGGLGFGLLLFLESASILVDPRFPEFFSPVTGCAKHTRRYEHSRWSTGPVVSAASSCRSGFLGVIFFLRGLAVLGVVGL